MQAKFTPGPWLVGKPSSIVGWPIVAPSAGGRMICNVTWAVTARGELAQPGDREFNAQSQANAYVLTAAPELYVALDRAVEALEFAYMNAPEQPREIAQGNAALKKARGE